MKRYCPKCKKNESQSECKYGPRFWATYSTPMTLTSNQLKYDIAQVHPANEEKDHEYSMARSEISTIISATKRLKKKMGKREGGLEAWVQSKITKAADYIDTAADYLDSGQGKVDESITIEDAEGNSFAEVIDIIGPNQMKPIVDEACWKGYKQVGMKKKGKKVVPNCVPANEQISFDIDKSALRTAQKREKIRSLAIKGSGGERDVAKAKLGPTAELIKLADSVELKTFSQFMEDWQKVNRQDKTDGLSPAAVKAYRRENPGSKLQTAVTEKNPEGKRAKRRLSFCRRMKGHKAKNTSAETARDPDSRINKALRRWNCN